MKIALIGAPVDLGANRRGVDMGASAIRYAGLEASLVAIGHEVEDRGNLPVPVAEMVAEGHSNLKYLRPIASMAEDLAGMVGQVMRNQQFPVVLGGDHSISLGSVAGVAEQANPGILWLDAHGDFNTASTSPSGNIHGMVLAALAGLGDDRLLAIGGRPQKVKPTHISVVGARRLDEQERKALVGAGVHVFTMHDVDRLGFPHVLEQAIERIRGDTDGLHLSLDLDVVDPLYAPGVGTPVPGGLTYRETHLAMEMISQSSRLISMDVVEVNPVLDRYNETARLAVELILSALGQRIL